MCNNFRLLFLGFIVLVISSGQVLAWEINFKRLFFGNNTFTELLSHRIVASYDSENQSLFVLINERTDQIFTMRIGETFNNNNEILILESFVDGSLVFKNSRGNKFTISYLPSDQSEKLEYKNKKEQEPINRFTLPNKETSLSELKLIALNLGVPNQLIESFVSIPPLDRDSVGRPGWVLDDGIPPALLKLSPFKKNDLIIAVNGIAINKLEELKKHIQSGRHNKFFEVEIERSGELKLIKVKF